MQLSLTVYSPAAVAGPWPRLWQFQKNAMSLSSLMRSWTPANTPYKPSAQSTTKRMMGRSSTRTGLVRMSVASTCMHEPDAWSTLDQYDRRTNQLADAMSHETHGPQLIVQQSTVLLHWLGQCGASAYGTHSWCKDHLPSSCRPLDSNAPERNHILWAAIAVKALPSFYLWNSAASADSSLALTKSLKPRPLCKRTDMSIS